MGQSGFLSLNWGDFIKGALVAVGGAVVATIKTSLDAGSLNFNWGQIGMVAVGAFISYLTVHFFSGQAKVS